MSWRRGSDRPGETAGHEDATWLRSPCLGQCERAPAVLVTVRRADAQDPRPGRHPRRRRRREHAHDGPPRHPALDHRRRRCRRARAAGGRPVAAAARRASGASTRRRSPPTASPAAIGRCAKALTMGPAAVIEEVTASKLVGRGGAAFPTGRKWAAVAAQPATPHYVVCNADESEPGTFKDRVILEHDPFALDRGDDDRRVRGRRLARLPVPARRVPARPRAPRGRHRPGPAGRPAGRQRRRARGWSFDIELRIGAGAYIAGEETALFESIEGGRPEPRNKPPFPVEVGLFGKPTVGQQRRDAGQRAR